MSSVTWRAQLSEHIKGIRAFAASSKDGTRQAPGPSTTVTMRYVAKRAQRRNLCWFCGEPALAASPSRWQASRPLRSAALAPVAPATSPGRNRLLAFSRATEAAM